MDTRPLRCKKYNGLNILTEFHFTLVKNPPPVLDNIKDSKTGLFVPFRNFELEMKPLEDGSPKAGMFIFRIGMVDRSYRAMNQARRYGSLFLQRNTDIKEVILELVSKPWTQLYSTTKTATTA